MAIPAVRILVGWLVLYSFSCLTLAQESPPILAPETLDDRRPSFDPYESQTEETENAQEEVVITYTSRKPHYEQTTSRIREPKTVVRYVIETQSVRLKLNADLDALDLPPDGKRAAVLAITAARHDGLLKKLKGAESEEEKQAAFDILTDNYTRHYAIETWWREQKLADLEKKLKELRDQVKQRNDSQEKYVVAAMTIAQLWADGIGIAPPKPNSAQTNGSPTDTNWPTPVTAPHYGPQATPQFLPGPPSLVPQQNGFQGRPPQPTEPALPGVR